MAARKDSRVDKDFADMHIFSQCRSVYCESVTRNSPFKCVNTKLSICVCVCVCEGATVCVGACVSISVALCPRLPALLALRRERAEPPPRFDPQLTVPPLLPFALTVGHCVLSTQNQKLNPTVAAYDVTSFCKHSTLQWDRDGLFACLYLSLWSNNYLFGYIYLVVYYE